MVNFHPLIPADRIRGDDLEDEALLRAMLAEAEAYLRGFAWCRDVGAGYLGYGVGGVFGVFLFEVTIEGSDDTHLWVAAGDVPHAYYVVDGIDTPAQAVEDYVALMRDWVDAVRSGGDLAQVFPVDAPADREHADRLTTRLDFIEAKLLPIVRGQRA